MKCLNRASLFENKYYETEGKNHFFIYSIIRLNKHCACIVTLRTNVRLIKHKYNTKKSSYRLTIALGINRVVIKQIHTTMNCPGM